MGKKKKLTAMNLDRFGYKSAEHKDVQVRCRILIVCEGEKTEPNYFKSFDRMQYGSVVYEVDCSGGRMNTVQVVDQAILMRDKAEKSGNPYDAVWAVFDKDDFPAVTFNAAIAKAVQNGIDCAWSNEAFELWYIYHFVNRTTPMSRDEYEKALNKFVNDSPNYVAKTKFVYKKNDPNARQILTTCGDELRAIKFAQSQATSFTDNNYAEHNPCTMVFALVRQLRGEDEAFNTKIMADLTTK